MNNPLKTIILLISLCTFSFSVCANEVDAIFDKTKSLVLKKDYKEAAKWYLKAAEKDHSRAQYNLALLYMKGLGVPRDEKEAFKWFLRAAENGNIEAQGHVGTMYIIGRGISPNYKHAYVWLTLAGMAGNDDAKKHLKIVSKALSVSEMEQSLEKAIKLYEEINNKS